jgi:hypothetical protein
VTRRQGKVSKQERRDQREQAARRRRLRNRAIHIAIWGGLGLLAALWSIDRSGPQELADAEVISTQQYQHVTQGSAPHFHTRATILIEESVEAVVDRAPAMQRGQTIQVWVRRGRISGHPYFQELPAGLSPEQF